MQEPIISPGGAIGILGGGQLARMMALAATQMGLRTVVYTDDACSSPAGACASVMIGPYDDEPALKAFAQEVDVVTYEF